MLASLSLPLGLDPFLCLPTLASLFLCLCMQLQLKYRHDVALLPCSFVTGGEDGYVRLQHFDATYFNLLNKQEL